MLVIKPFAVIALLEDFPAENVRRGQVGTIVDTLASGAFLVEFADENGEEYAMLALQPDQVMELHHTQPAKRSDSLERIDQIQSQPGKRPGPARHQGQPMLDRRRGH